VATGTFGPPHYFNSTWMVYAVFVWVGIDALVRRLSWLRLWVPVQVGSLLVFLVGFALSMHALGGARFVHYGPTIANQIEVARALGTLAPNSGLLIEVKHQRLFQASVMTLADLLGLAVPPVHSATSIEALAGVPPPWYAIGYARGAPPYAARVELRRVR